MSRKNRDQANPMPLGQVADVLDAAWGTDWKTGFRRFNFTPLAAASIGQVHEAETKDGRRLAIKIQYPGIARSIDSDLDNVVSLLRMFRLLPADFDIDPLVDEAKRQLHMEADYLTEASHLRAYAAHMGSEPGLRVPGVADDLTTATVLAMEMVGSFRMLIEAILVGSDDAVEQAAEAVGYLAPDDTPAYRRAVVEMVSMAAEPARFPGAYDFAAADLSERMSEHVMCMHTQQGFGRLPPPDLLYIHRKLAGLYLLLKRLRAKVPLSELIAPYLSRRQ